MFLGPSEAQTPCGESARNPSELKERAPPLLMLLRLQIDFWARWKVHCEVKDGRLENESQRTNGRVISRSDKPEGLISNIPHFRVNYSTEMQWGEYQTASSAFTVKYKTHRQTSINDLIWSFVWIKVMVLGFGFSSIYNIYIKFAIKYPNCKLNPIKK